MWKLYRYGTLRNQRSLPLYHFTGRKYHFSTWYPNAMLAANAASKKFEVGIYLGKLKQQPPPVIPRVCCALLSPQQAAATVARGVAIAFADVAA